MTVSPAAATRKRSSKNRRKSSQHSERLRMFSPDIVALIRADIKKAHGKPEPSEPSVMEFMEQFFDEIHSMRVAKYPWNAIHERIRKYIDCSSRTIQTYYNALAQKRGLADEPARSDRHRAEGPKRRSA